MKLAGVEIEDTFAEAFSMTAARAIITAESAEWARIAATEAIGYGTSVIGCDAEAGIEREMAPEETPDGRPGVSILVFAFSRPALQSALVGRIGQCVLTCPTTACYDGLPQAESGKRVRVGGNLRFFGDGFQIAKRLERRRYWRIPVMDGEFVCEDRFGTVKGVAGGNLLILGESQSAALSAAQEALDAIRKVRDCVTPFPGGIVRSGSKVGSRYKKLRASTNDAYCPTLRGLTDSTLSENTGAVYEIVIDGLDRGAVEQAMRAGIHGACRAGVLRITAGNYGGNLGPHHIYLHRLMEQQGEHSPASASEAEK